MEKKIISGFLLGLVLGILPAFLFKLGSSEARYVPFGSQGNQILDTRNGRLFAKSAESKTWVLTVQNINE